MERKTLDDIYKSYMDDIYRYIISLCHDHYLSEDIMQETFYRAYLYLESFSGERVKPWLFRVAYNTFVDYTRKQKKVSPVDCSLFENQAGSRTLEDEVLGREQFKEIESIIKGLPENQRQAILLYDFSGLSYSEASEVMNVSINHFKILLFRARQRIREEGRSGVNGR